MKNDVFNNLTGSQDAFYYPNLTPNEERVLLATLYEQLLIFDRISLSTNRINFSLFFLIKNLGLEIVERMITAGYIRFILWSPIIVTGTGRQRDDNTIDESVIYGQPPIVAGQLSDEDLDPEHNIKQALRHFRLNSKTTKNIIKKALPNYITPEGMEFSTQSAALVIDAYKHNNLHELGLPYEKEPEQLTLDERGRLLDLGHKVLETAVLSRYGLKSYNSYEHLKICENNLQNIGKGYNVAENTSHLFNLENLPNLKELYMTGKLEFDTVFKIRHLSNAKYYRKWINEVGEDSNAQEITTEYLKEIKGKHKFFEKPGGKLLKNVSMFGVNAALGAAVAGPAGATAGFALGLLETFWIDSLLKGKDPSMFLEDMRKRINTTDNKQ